MQINGIPKGVRLIPLKKKIEMSKSKTKVLKKEPREMENQRKNEKKKDEKKDKENDPSRDEK